MSLFRESIWYLGGCSALCFGSSWFVTDCVVPLSLYTEAGTIRNCSILRQMINDGGIMTVISCNNFSDDRTFLLQFQVVLPSNINQILSWNFITWCLFLVCKFPLSRFTMRLHRKWTNSFGRDWRKWRLHLRESDWNTWRVEIFSVHCPNFLNALNDPEYKSWTEQNHCLCNIVNYRLSAATNQSKKYQREQPLHLDTSQLALNQDPSVC